MFDKLKGDPIVGLLIIVFGLLFFIPSLSLGLSAPGKIAGPGAGFFPALTSAFVMFFGAWIVYDAIKKGNKVKYFEDDSELKANFKVIGFTILTFVVFLFLWKYVNFYLGILCISLVYNFIFGRSFKFNVIYTVVILALLYFIFQQLLYISFDI